MNRRRFLAASLASVISLPHHDGTAADERTRIRLATTTSVVNSGLLQRLRTAFESETGYSLEVEAFGTGRALRRAREGNADVLIVHFPAAEKKFMRAGHGLVRLPLMKNQFILAGPMNDPAGVADSTGVIGAFKAIAARQARFVSRGDDSGTHKKELEIWQHCKIEPYGKWYIEYGHGMGNTLHYADALNAYVLVDSGTWLARREQLQLVVLFAVGTLLENPYHIIAVNPSRHPSVNGEAAQRFVTWMTSKRAQDIIENFAINDEPSYTPAGAIRDRATH